MLRPESNLEESEQKSSDHSKRGHDDVSRVEDVVVFTDTTWDVGHCSVFHCVTWHGFNSVRVGVSQDDIGESDGVQLVDFSTGERVRGGGVFVPEHVSISDGSVLVRDDNEESLTNSGGSDLRFGDGNWPRISLGDVADAISHVENGFEIWS